MATVLRQVNHREPDVTRCLLCGRAYAGTSSKPRWVSDGDGRVVGTLHASCYPRIEHGLAFVGSMDESLDRARRFAWVRLRWIRRDGPVEWGVLERAENLLDLATGTAEDLTATLNAAQAERLAWWQEHEPWRKELLTPTDAGEVVVRYGELVAEYRAWHEAIYGAGGGR